MSGGPGHARLQETLNRVNLWKIGQFAFIRNSRVGLCLNGSLKNCIDPEKYCSAEPQICRIDNSALWGSVATCFSPHMERSYSFSKGMGAV